MRILMVLDHEFPPDIRVENEIEALVKDGNEVHVACFTMKGAKHNDSYLGATIHRKDISKLMHKTSVGALKFPFYFNFWRSFLESISDGLSFEAIHIHDLPLAKVGYEFAKDHKCSFTLDLHENWPALLDISTHTKSLLGRFLSNTKQWEKYEVKYCKLADNVIVVVDEAKQRLVDLGVKPSSIKIVSNTLNTSNFDLTDEKPDPEFFTLLYAGGITKHRGLQYIIQGLKFLGNTEKQIKVKILGTGSYLKNLVDLAKSENVESMVDFEGWKPYAEMIKYVGRADICLIPHVKNNHTDSTIPHKLFQYMYASKPIIASNCLPIERITLDTESGLIYNFDTPSEFASAVMKLIDDKELYNHMCSSGKKNVVKDYTWSGDSNVLNSIYSG